eukprot:5461903-Amphidinium_carterae.1
MSKTLDENQVNEARQESQEQDRLERETRKLPATRRSTIGSGTQERLNGSQRLRQAEGAAQKAEKWK